MSIDITLLCCPDCGGQSSLKLNQNNHNLHCTTCNNEYAYNNGVPIFLDTTTINANQVSGQQTAISSIKQALHKITRPRHHSIYFDTLESSLQNGIELDKFIQDFSNKSNVLNVGSLAKQLTKKDVNIINLDISHYNNIDVVADAHRIPIKDGSLDGIIIKNVFEHIREPIVVRDELFRTLKKGGRIYAKVPFMQPFHAVPNDFQRYTINGLKEFFKDFKVLKHGIAIGPSSTISWMLIEYFAMLFSFNTETGYKVSLRIASYLFFWVKYLDVFLRKNVRSHTLASAFYLVLEKPA